MMQISNVNVAENGSTMQTAKKPVNMELDSVSKDIQNKIMNAQKQQQDLLSNREMTAEEKENQRQKIQQEISDLKRELRQYQAEQKKKQQEADKAAEAKKEQKERASKEAVRDQQRKDQLTEDSNGQEKISQSDRSKQSYSARTEQENKEMLPPDSLHKIIFTDSSLEQFRVVSNVTAQMDGRTRIQESELEQDAARGVDVESVKKAHRAEIQKETNRMQTMQAFMFRRKGPTAGAFAGMDSQFSNSVIKKGLYSHNGIMSENNFPPIQMDLRQ